MTVTLSPGENLTAMNARANALAVYNAPAAAGIVGAAGLGALPLGLSVTGFLLTALNGGDPALWSALTGKPKDFFKSTGPGGFVFGSGNQMPTPGARDMESWYGPGDTRFRSWREPGGLRVVRVRSYNAAGWTAALVSAGNAALAGVAGQTVSNVASGLGADPLISAGSGIVDGTGGAVMGLGLLAGSVFTNTWNAVTVTDDGPTTPEPAPENVPESEPPWLLIAGLAGAFFFL